MNPDFTSYEKNGTVYYKYDVEPTIVKPWPKSNHPLVPAGPDYIVCIDECLGLIYNAHFLKHTDSPCYLESQIIEKLNQLSYVDSSLVWDHIQAFFNDKDSSTGLARVLGMTARISYYLAKSNHAHLVDEIWQQRAIYLPIRHLDRLDQDLVRWIAEQIDLEGPKDDFVLLLDEWDELPLILRLPQLLLLEKEERPLTLVSAILKKAPALLQLELSETKAEEALETLDGYWKCYNYLWLDLNELNALRSIGENGRIDSYLFMKILDLLETSDTGFYFLQQCNLVDACIDLLEEVEVDQEVVIYLVNHPGFLQGLTRIDKKTINSETFWALYRMNLSLKLDRLMEVDDQTNIEDDLNQILTGFLALQSFLGGGNTFREVCDKISMLAIKHKIKPTSICGPWFKLTEQLDDGSVYGLDRSIAATFEKGLPKELPQQTLIKFFARLAADSMQRVGAIKMAAKLVSTADKRRGITLPEGFSRQFTGLASAKKYEGMQELLKSLWILCEHLSSKPKHVDIQEDREFRDLFGTLLSLLSELNEKDSALLNDQTWKGIIALGKKFGVWEQWQWQGRIPEVDKRLLLEAFHNDQNKLQGGPRDAEQVKTMFLRQAIAAQQHPHILKSKFVDLLFSQLSRYLRTKETNMSVILGDLLCHEPVVTLLSDPALKGRIIETLSHFVRELVDMKSDNAAKIACDIADSYRYPEEPLWGALFSTILEQLKNQETLEDKQYKELQSVLNRFKGYLFRQKASLSETRFDKLRRDMLNIGLYAHATPRADSIQQILELRGYLHIEMSKDNPREFILALNRYMKLVGLYEGELPENEPAHLHSFYLYAMQKMPFQMLHEKEISLIELQCNLLRFFTARKPENIDYRVLLVEMIENPESSAACHKEFAKIVEGLFYDKSQKNMDDVTELFESIENVINTNVFNANRVLLFASAVLQEGNGHYYDRIDSIMDAFITHSYGRKHTCNPELFAEVNQKLSIFCKKSGPEGDKAHPLNLFKPSLKSKAPKRIRSKKAQQAAAAVECMDALFNIVLHNGSHFNRSLRELNEGLSQLSHKMMNKGFK